MQMMQIELTQVIDAGVLSTDVIDASGNTVANPTITFPVKTQEASVQTNVDISIPGTNRALVKPRRYFSMASTASG